MLAHLAQRREIRAAAVAQDAAGPGVDGRLARLVPRLLEEGDQRRAARAAQFLAARPLLRGGAVAAGAGEVLVGLGRLARAEGAGVRAGFARLDDDVPGDHLDVFVAQGAEHGQAGVEGDAQRAVPTVGFDVFADVGDVGDVFEEAPVRAGHVGAHVVDEVLAGWRRGSFDFAFGAAVGVLLACRAMLDAENDVEELDEGALCVAAAAVLTIGFVTAAVFVDDAVWKTSFGHVFATSQERSDAVVEDVRVAILVHPYKQ